MAIAPSIVKTRGVMGMAQRGASDEQIITSLRQIWHMDAGDERAILDDMSRLRGNVAWVNRLVECGVSRPDQAAQDLFRARVDYCQLAVQTITSSVWPHTERAIR